MQKIPGYLIASLVCVVLLLGASALAATVRDMLGRTVDVATPARRIVSLIPSVTETLYALDTEGQLVGVTTLCDFPPAAREKPKVGGIVKPSLEAIVTLKPDLVLATTEGNRDTTFQDLEALGLPVYVLSPKRFSGVLGSIRRIASLTGRETAAEALATELRTRAARVSEATSGRPAPRVLYLIWADPVVVPGRDTLITELIRMAGGFSVSEDLAEDWPRLSLEQVVAKAPEVIVFGSHNRVQVENALSRWQEQGIVLPALRSGRVYTVDGDLLHRPGPRVVLGLEALARAIHPGALP
jgi:iron complex transport system substrate-binding protein